MCFFLSLSSIAVAPTHVTITGATEARVGDVVPLQCTTAPSNPPAEIKWMVAGKQIRNATSKTVVSPEGMLILVISLIQHVHRRRERNMYDYNNPLFGLSISLLHTNTHTLSLRLLRVCVCVCLSHISRSLYWRNCSRSYSASCKGFFSISCTSFVLVWHAANSHWLCNFQFFFRHLFGRSVREWTGLDSWMRITISLYLDQSHLVHSSYTVYLFTLCVSRFLVMLLQRMCARARVFFSLIFIFDPVLHSLNDRFSSHKIISSFCVLTFQLFSFFINMNAFIQHKMLFFCFRLGNNLTIVFLSSSFFGAFFRSLALLFGSYMCLWNGFAGAQWMQTIWLELRYWPRSTSNLEAITFGFELSSYELIFFSLQFVRSRVLLLPFLVLLLRSQCDTHN